MKFIGVIACLGLLLGTSFQTGAVPADSTKNLGSDPSAPCLNCTDSQHVKGESSLMNQTQPLADNAGEIQQISDSPSAPNISKTESTSDSQSRPQGTNSTIISPANASDIEASVKPPNGTDTTTTEKPSPPPSTTSVEPTSTTEKTPTTSVTSTTEKSTTTAVPSTTSGTTPTPASSSTSTVPSTPPSVSSTKAALTTQAPTDKPSEERRFDGPSFIGGIVFALGVTAIAFVAWKFYKARTERNYHTL